MRPIYLDNNSTTAIHPEVAAAIHDCYLRGFANPASQHDAGRRARRTLEEAREAIAEMLGACTTGQQADRLIFTSGGTESNNLAIRGLAGPAPGTVIISAIEHPSISAVADALVTEGMRVFRLPVSRQGIACLEQLDSLIDDQTRLVSVMLGNHETGVMQPVGDLVGLAHRRGALVHTDAVQAVGKVAISFRQLAVDSLSFAAHKFHGPVGIGGLLIRPEVSLRPLLHGGFQQAGLRPGTESLPLVVGLRKALEIVSDGLVARSAQLQMLRDRLAAHLRAGFDGVVVHGEEVPRMPHTLNVSFRGLDRQALVMAFDMVHVACSAGSACASGSSELSPVLVAMGLPRELIEGAIRLSLSMLTTEADIDEAARRILKVANDLRHRISTRRVLLPPRVMQA
jgi:cysteine desulfurase